MLKIKLMASFVAFAALAASASGVTDPWTGLPANGDEASMRAIPGWVQVIREDDVIFATLREPAGTGWIASDNTVSAFGRVRESGAVVYDHIEAVPTNTLIDSGVLKNPGPDVLLMEFFTSQGAVTLTVPPGGAVEIGTDRTDVLLGTHSWQCKCRCDVPMSQVDEDITMSCYDGTNPCTCDCYEDATCWLGEELTEGTAKSCAAGLAPEPDTGTGG